MVFSRLRAKKLYLPSSSTLENALVEWAIAPEHENSTLLMPRLVTRFIEKNVALTSYDDTRFIGVLKHHVFIGSYISYKHTLYVRLDMVYETYPEHRLVYNNTIAKISPALGIYIAAIEG